MAVVVAPVLPAAPTVAGDGLYRLSVDQYHQMIRAGILTDDTPVELLEGCLVQKMSKNPPHRLTTGLLQDALLRLLPAGWHLNVQDPLTTSDSEPEPDLAVVRGQRRDYTNRHPEPPDMSLVIEVADTSLQRDRTIKKRLYARAGIPAYWIVNLGERQVEVYTAPSGPTAEPDYGQRQDHGPDEQVPVTIAGLEIGRLLIRDLLP